MQTINQIKAPRIYNIVIFDGGDFKADTLNKVFGDTFGYDFIYAAQKMLEIKNAGKTVIGPYSYDITKTLINEIKQSIPNINIEFSEVSV